MSDTPVPILMYHAVSTAPNDATRELSVAPEAFAGRRVGGKAARSPPGRC